MEPSPLQPFAFLLCGWRHRRLIAQLARNRTQARYRGSLLGGFWVLALPLLMLGVYTFVFSVVLETRWSGPDVGPGHFPLLLFAGLILFNVFAECANEAPGLMQANQAYIKQVLFPSEVLAWVSLVTALWRCAASLGMLLAFYALVIGWPPLASAAGALALLPLAGLTLGSVWLLASLGVFLRDLSQVISVFTAALLFLSPVFYPASRVPEALRPWLGLNPFVPILETWRQSLFDGRLPDWSALALVTAASWGVAWAGYAWFMKTKGSFADVL